MKILITGGAGFIGSHLTDYHLAKGDEVCAIDDLSTGTVDNLQSAMKNSNFRLIKADIVSSRLLDPAVEWADQVYHLASIVGMLRVMEDPLQVLKANIIGTERVLRMLIPSQKVLVASSSEAYDLSVGKSFNFVRWNYALSKLTAEALALSYAKNYNLDVRIARIFNTIGTRQAGSYGMVVPRFVRQAVMGDSITVYGDGRQTRSFCPVEDTVRALDILMSAPEAKGETFDVGSNCGIAILELAALIKARAESESNIVFVSYERAYLEGFEDVRCRAANLNKLFKLADNMWEFGHLDSALDKIIEWERNK